MSRPVTLACAVIFVLGLGAGILRCQAPGCTSAQASRAERATVNLRCWDALYNWYVSYKHCDDGAIGEGYSEDVARVLVDHWNTLPRLDELLKKDPAFKGFVLRHINATLLVEDVQRVSANAKAKCPAGLQALCRDVRGQANTALQELASPDSKE